VFAVCLEATAKKRKGTNKSALLLAHVLPHADEAPEERVLCSMLDLDHTAPVEYKSDRLSGHLVSVYRVVAASCAHKRRCCM